MPVYNGAKYIAVAIESALSQTFQDFELIIIDNHSTDNTVEIISKYKDDRVRFFQNAANLGWKDNWNKALRLARGEFVKILPDDDVIYPGCLEKQVEALDDPQNAGVVLTCCARDVVDEKGRKIFRRSFGFARGRVSGETAIKKNIAFGTNLLGEPVAALFRKNILAEVGEFDEAFPFSSDLNLWLRMLLHGDVFVIPEALCAFRVSRCGLSFSMLNSQSRMFCQFIDHLCLDQRYALDRRTCLQGKLMAAINEMLRRLFYLLIRSGSILSRS